MNGIAARRAGERCALYASALPRFAALAALALALCVTAAPVFALDGLSRYVFVPSRTASSVAVVDASTDSVVKTLRLPERPEHLAISKTLNYLVAANEGTRTVSIVELAIEKTVATLRLDLRPQRMLIDPSGDVVVVADVDAGIIVEISLRQLAETGRITGLQEPNTMFFSRDGKLLFVGNQASDSISVVDTAAGKVTGTIRVRDDTESSSRENGVRAVASTPYAWAGFALSGNGRDLAIIDLRSRVRVKTIHLRDVADRPYATQDGAFMIIPSSADKSVTLVSLETMAEVARLPGAADVTDVRTGYLDTLAFVVSRGENKVVVIDLVERRTIGDIPLPGRPELAVTSPDGSKLYVALVDVSKLAVIDVIHRRLLNVIASGVQAPWGGFTAGSLAYCH